MTAIPLRKKLTAELLGTFALVFAGTGAIIISQVSGGSISHAGIAMTFGLVVMAMIYALGGVSGAHINPAVTIAFWIARRFPGREVLPYVIAQCLGALLASFVLLALFPEHTTLGATIPAGPDMQSFVLEFTLTLVLMFVILSVATGSKEQGMFAGISIGGVVALEALFAGPICGASMNPARSLAPAIAALAHGTTPIHALWIYLVAPTLGAGLAVYLCRAIHFPGCCANAACRPEAA